MDEFVKFIGQNMPWALVGLSFSLGCLAGYGLFDLIEWLRKRAIARIKQSDTAAVDGLGRPAVTHVQSPSSAALYLKKRKGRA